MEKSKVVKAEVSNKEEITLTQNVKVEKVYGIAKGKLPEFNEKNLGLHAIIITEAITEMINNGKETATRKEIMEKAVEMGLFTKKPTIQKEPAIFAWWRKPLFLLGWLKY